MDGWTDKWMERWVNRSIVGWINKQINKQTNRWNGYNVTGAKIKTNTLLFKTIV